MRIGGILLSALYLVLMALPAQSAEITGPAAVVDGDTLDVGGRQVRLLGIDAFEGAQELPLKTGGTDFVGRGAAMMLRSLITSKEISCTLSSVSDGRGLSLATCYSGHVNLAREMIANGLAFAARSHRSPYADIEALARSARRGFWRDKVEAPWGFRERRVKEAAVKAPNACPFKGVIVNGGKTLVAPWSPWYPDVKVISAKGGRWFCSEKHAVKQGWHEPRWLIQSVVTGVYNPGN